MDKLLVIILLSVALLFSGCSSTGSAMGNAVKNYQTAKSEGGSHGGIKDIVNKNLTITFAQPVKKQIVQGEYAVYEDGTETLLNYGFVSIDKGEEIYVKGKNGETYELRFVDLEGGDRNSYKAKFELLKNNIVVSQSIPNGGDSFSFKDDKGESLTDDFTLDSMFTPNTQAISVTGGLPPEATQ